MLAVRVRDRRFFSLLFLLLFTARIVDAAFSHSAYWKLDKVDQSSAGGWCFYPVLKPEPLLACSNSTLSRPLNTHVNNDRSPGLSIAYYDLKDGSALGGARWAEWNAVALPVGVCMSGVVGAFANTYSTTCRFAVADEDHDSASAHIIEYTANQPQLRVTDGCYTPPPRRGRFRLDDSTTGILTIIGLIIALPSVIFGVYRWYRARRVLTLQQAQLENGQALPLVPVHRHSGGTGSQGLSYQDASHSAG